MTTQDVRGDALDAMDGRSGRRKTVRVKRWWRVDYLWRGQQFGTTENSLGKAVEAANERAESVGVTDVSVVEVEVVERRRTVKRLKTASPIDPAQRAPKGDVR